MLVIRGFGIQTSTSSSTYLSTAATRFIPTTQIQDIVIHEAFKGFEVRFYLAVIVEDEPGVLVVFPVSRPLTSLRPGLMDLLEAITSKARDLRTSVARFPALSIRCKIMSPVEAPSKTTRHKPMLSYA